MGRIKKYQTIEEKKIAKYKRAHDYYWNNKDKQDERARNYARERKNKTM